MSGGGHARLRWSPPAVVLLALVTLLAALLARWMPGSIARLDWLFFAAPLAFGALFLAARANFDALMLFAFCLLGLVRNEPAPVDALSLALLLIGILVGRLSLRTLAGATPLQLLVWAFLISNQIALFISGSSSLSQRYVLITYYLVAFAYFVRLYLTSVRASRVVVTGYAISVLISALLVGLGHLGVGGEGLFITEQRATAYFKDPNVFGPTPILLVLLLLDDLWHPKSALLHLPRSLRLLGVAMGSALVVLSFSRAAVANLVVSLAIYFALNLRSFTLKRLAWLTGALLLVGGATIGLLEAFSLVEFFWGRTAFQPYDIERFATHEHGLDLALSRFFGVGPGMLSGAHSLYVRAVAEYGVLGSLPLLAAIGLPAISVFRAAIAEDRRPLGLSARVIAAAFAGLLVNSLVIDSLHWRQLWLVWGLAWAVCAAARARDPAPARRSARRVAWGALRRLRTG